MSTPYHLGDGSGKPIFRDTFPASFHLPSLPEMTPVRYTSDVGIWKGFRGNGMGHLLQLRYLLIAAGAAFLASVVPVWADPPVLGNVDQTSREELIREMEERVLGIIR